MKIVLIVFVLTKTIVSDVFGNVVLETTEDATRMDKLEMKCKSALELYAENLKNSTDDNMWALRMWDASSKAPVGLMSYNFGEMGNFDQCMATKSVSDNIMGKYCLATITFTNTSRGTISGNDTSLQREQKHWRKLISIASAAPAGSPTWAICVPSNCSDGDVLNILSGMQLYGMDLKSVTCQTKNEYEPQFTIDVIICISVLAAVLLAMILSTCYDLYCSFEGKGPAHPSLIAWSVYTNGRKLFQLEEKRKKLSSLNGMRFISMMWILVLHTRSVYSSGPNFNFKDFTDVFSKPFRELSNYNLHYITVIFRLTPPFAGVIMITPLLRFLGSGPRWGSVEDYFASPCKKYWWSALLYVQIYVNPGTPCIIPSWYLDVDMQLFVFSPLILFLLVKRPKLAIAALVSASLAVISAGFVQAYVNRLPGIMYADPSAITFGNYLTKFYFKTQFRAAPWLMGIILGYFLTKDAITLVKIPMVLSALAWLVSFVVMTLCIFSAHTILRSPDQDRIGNAFYVALQRPAWSACIGWIIWACATDRGGVINSILSHQLFQFLNKFTYSIYLLHYLILCMMVFSQKVSFQYTLLNVVYSTCGLFLFSLGVSIIWVLAFEIPALVLERILLRNK